jgi:hypothetical protein
MENKELANKICDYIATPFGIGLNGHVRNKVAEMITNDMIKYKQLIKEAKEVVRVEQEDSKLALESAIFHLKLALQDLLLISYKKDNNNEKQ